VINWPTELKKIGTGVQITKPSSF